MSYLGGEGGPESPQGFDVATVKQESSEIPKNVPNTHQEEEYSPSSLRPPHRDVLLFKDALADTLQVPRHSESLVFFTDVTVMGHLEYNDFGLFSSFSDH